MTDDEFDRALIAAGFRLADERGWRRVTIAEAARTADLPMDRARRRFPGRVALLLRFGSLADQAALAEKPGDVTVREALFDMIMRRIDVLQAHRAGVLALFSALPSEPLLALMLADATQRSMAWLLEAAGVSTGGVQGKLRIHGLTAVWLWTVRAWRGDESLDLSATLAALDKALGRAESVAPWLRDRMPLAAPPPAAAPEPPPEPPPFAPVVPPPPDVPPAFPAV